MTPHPERRTSVPIWAGIAFVLSLLATISFVFGAGWGDGAAGLVVAAQVGGGIVAPALLTVAVVLLTGPALRLGRAASAAIIATGTVGFGASTLTGWSFSVGMEEADTGAAPTPFGDLTWPLALASVATLAVAFAIVLFHALRQTRLPLWAVVPLAVAPAALLAPFAVYLVLLPLATAVGSLAVSVVAAYPSASTVAPAPPVARSSARRVRVLGAATLAYAVVVWVGAIAVSIVESGTDVATSVYGWAMAATQLAVIPLLLAFTVIRPRRGRGPAVAAGIAIVVVAVSSVAMLAFYSPDGTGLLLLAPIGLAVGGWAATIAWPHTAGTDPASRALLVSVAVLGTALVYAATAVSAGIAVATVGGILAAGVGTARRGTAARVDPAQVSPAQVSPAQVSPGTLPASP